MRFPLVLCLIFYVAQSIAMGQLADPDRSPTPAPQTPATPEAIPESVPVENLPQQPVPQQPVPQQPVPQQPVPQPDPGASFNSGQLTPLAPGDLDLDSNQSFGFNDTENYQYGDSSDLDSSLASNSNFRDASPQMIGDFGGGSTMLNVLNVDSTLVSMPLPLAGGGRRIKIAENNQVVPLNRVYGTFNYFHDAYQTSTTDPFTDTVEKSVSESLVQYTFGFEKAFVDDKISIDLRMPFTGGIDQQYVDLSPLSLNSDTGAIGNLSVTLKAYLLKAGANSISGGLGISIPTGSDTDVVYDGVSSGSGTFSGTLKIDNDAVHLMPFVGVYRPFGRSCSWWLQAFTQVDVSSRGNDVRANGGFLGRLTEQNLLYSDISLGKWWYRSRCDCPRRSICDVTGVASLLELHYTTSLNDADSLLNDILVPGVPGISNRFDVLNMTAGLQVEFSRQWRVNVAGVFPLKDGHTESDRFFDGEFSLQINRFF